MECYVKYSPRNGVMKVWKLKEAESMIIREIDVLTHFDNGTILLNFRFELMRWCDIASDDIEKWVLMVHVGYDGEKDKLKHQPCYQSKNLKNG